MTQNTDDGEQAGFWGKYGVIFAALVILVGLMLPPVKSWLNAIPYLWNIVYPLLTLFALFVLIKVVQLKDGPVTLFKWVLLLIAAAAMTVAKFGWGAVFFTIGRTVAVIFIVLELGTFLYDAIRKE